MNDDNQLAKALDHLKEGKFSFQMVDCITESIQKQKEELDELLQFREKATVELGKRDYDINRLEKSLRSANAKIFALIKTNALLEHGIDATKIGAVKLTNIVIPKILELLEKAKPHVLEAASLAKTVSLKAFDAAEPAVREWWLTTEPRRKKLIERLQKLSSEFSTKSSH